MFSFRYHKVLLLRFIYIYVFDFRFEINDFRREIIFVHVLIFGAQNILKYFS